VNLPEYAEEVGISKQGAAKAARKGEWASRDGRRWRSTARDSGNGKTSWDIQSADGRPTKQTLERMPGNLTVMDLKALDLEQNVLLKQNRNDRIWRDRFRDWDDILHTALLTMCGSVSARIMSLRLNKDVAEKINAIYQDGFADLDAALSAELKAYWDQQKERLRK